MNICVIPARGGSKRIPRKNIKHFCGKPIIAWSIQAAIESNCFGKIVVSTDDCEIAQIARDFGAETPFVRPPYLSDDHTGTTEVVAHTIEHLKTQTTSIDAVCCIYATAPFVTYKTIRLGLESLRDQKASYAFTVTSYPFPIQRAIRITQDNRVEMLQPEHLESRSQDLENTYHDAGQLYWGTAEAWLTNKPIFGLDSIPIVLPRHIVQDIDTNEDWERAEWLFKAAREKA